MAAVKFSHVHMYADSLKELAEYKKLEKKLNAFEQEGGSLLSTTSTREGADVQGGRAAWLALSAAHGEPCTGKREPADWKGAQQDVVEQMLVGLGWRITGFSQTDATRSVAVTSKDDSGVKFVITAHNKLGMGDLGGSSDASPAKRQKKASDCADHLDSSHLERFSKHRAGRAGVAVLGFAAEKGGVDAIFAKYTELHPKLVLPDMPKTYNGAKVLEVFAYYKGEKGKSEADCGTVLRFIEQTDPVTDFWVLPGISKTEAVFAEGSFPAFCDHWVSNVVSREGFLDTLNETLGFTPKVDFNAGVVAAGEAQIESTVTGNAPGTTIADAEVALRDQSQVYLPINNALSEVGHVHLYLKEIGQGIQHIASRVKDLPAMIQRTNDFRKMTGSGLSFLSIPPSYYGSLTAKRLSLDAKIELSVAERYVSALGEAGIVDKSDIVRLDATIEQVKAALPKDVDGSIVEHIMRGRYNNLYALLRDHLSETTYLRIVRNNILVDVQGDDLLMQIFTCQVLQRAAGQEAPFLEFIQRVCSEKKDAAGKPKPMKPGCGGFGIRNFLTLFLSIEVSKASKARAEAVAAGKAEAVTYYGKMVDAFTSQLDESNPVLTAISDAMTAEGEALTAGDKAEAARQGALKTKGNSDLQVISSKYKAMMKHLRENKPADA